MCNKTGEKYLWDLLIDLFMKTNKGFVTSTRHSNTSSSCSKLETCVTLNTGIDCKNTLYLNGCVCVCSHATLHRFVSHLGYPGLKRLHTSQQMVQKTVYCLMCVFTSHHPTADHKFILLTSRDEMKKGISLCIWLRSLARNTLTQMTWNALSPIWVILKRKKIIIM